jgi:hypothetical protein
MIKVLRSVFDATAVRVVLVLFLALPVLGFLIWTLLIEGTGFASFFSTASAGERATLRLAAMIFWTLVVGWLGVFTRLLCSSSYLDTVPVLRFTVLLFLAAFTIVWMILLFQALGVSWLMLLPSLLTLFLALGTLPLHQRSST